MLGTAQCRNINKSKPHFHKNVLSTGKIQQGDLIFIDKYVFKTKGKISNTRGKEYDHEMYNDRIIFVDATTGFIKVFHQTSLRASYTLRSKHAVDHIFREHVITIKKYHDDNIVYFKVLTG